jgi:hypothetical protein
MRRIHRISAPLRRLAGLGLAGAAGVCAALGSSPPAAAATATGALEVLLVNAGPDADARGRLRYLESTTARSFELDLERLAPGPHQLYVDGVLELGFSASGAKLEFDFEDPPDPTPDAGQLELPLTFDPLGASVEIRSGPTLHLAARVPGSSSETGSNAPPPSRAAVDTGSTRGDSLLATLYNVGVIAGASGTAELRQNGPSELTVAVSGLPDASYELYVGGAKRADLPVAGGAGRLDFSTAPYGGALPLAFAVKGAPVEVRRLGTVVLGRVFPTDVQSALGRFDKETRTWQYRVNLRNAGVDLDANGSAEWRSSSGVESLKIDARDLPAGTYRLFAAGVEQGSGVADTRGSLRLVYDSKAGSRAQPLDFAVFRQTLELRNEGGQTVLDGVVE